MALASSAIPAELSGELSAEELAEFCGTDPSKPLLVAVKGTIYDVSSAANFYGPDGPYGAFAGRDASRALAIMSVKEADVSSSLEGLTEKQMETLEQWERKFQAKYPVAGRLVSKTQA